MAQSIPMPKLGKEPPKEIKLFSFGANPTVKGTVYLTQEAAKRVMDNFYKDGLVLPIDEEHFNLPGGSPGHFKLDLRDDGLWAAPVQFTKKFSKKISDGDYIYFSPHITLNEKREIESVKAIALTNQPAMKAIKPLLLSANTMNSKIKIMKSMLGALQESMRYGQTLISEGTMSEEKELIAEQVEGIAEYSTKLMAVLEKNGEKATDEEIKEEEDEMLKNKTETDAEERAETPKESSEEKYSVNANSMKKIMEILGSKTEEEAIGVVLGMKTQVGKLELKLNSLEKMEKEVLIEKAIQEKKIAPNQREMFLSQSKPAIISALKWIDKNDEEITPKEKITELVLSAAEPAVNKGVLPNQDVLKIQSAFKSFLKKG